MPDHVVTFGVRWDNRVWVNVAANVRYVGGQFEDDLNTHETSAVQRTSDGIVTIGTPRFVRGGLRLTYSLRAVPCLLCLLLDRPAVQVRDWSVMHGFGSA